MNQIFKEYSKFEFLLTTGANGDRFIVDVLTRHNIVSSTRLILSPSQEGEIKNIYIYFFNVIMDRVILNLQYNRRLNIQLDDVLFAIHSLERNTASTILSLAGYDISSNDSDVSYVDASADSNTESDTQSSEEDIDAESIEHSDEISSSGSHVPNEDCYYDDDNLFEPTGNETISVFLKVIYREFQTRNNIWGIRFCYTAAKGLFEFLNDHMALSYEGSSCSILLRFGINIKELLQLNPQPSQLSTTTPSLQATSSSSSNKELVHTTSLPCQLFEYAPQSDSSSKSTPSISPCTDCEKANISTQTDIIHISEEYSLSESLIARIRSQEHRLSELETLVTAKNQELNLLRHQIHTIRPQAECVLPLSNSRKDPSTLLRTEKIAISNNTYGTRTTTSSATAKTDDSGTTDASVYDWSFSRHDNTGDIDASPTYGIAPSYTPHSYIEDNQRIYCNTQYASVDTNTTSSVRRKGDNALSQFNGASKRTRFS